MNPSEWKETRRRLSIACVLAGVFVVALRAQPPTGVLRGQVTDPSGGAVVGATVLLTRPSGAAMDTTTNKDGVYEFKDLVPGKYEVKAVAQGFATFTKSGVAIAAGQTLKVNIPLEIEVQQEKVVVNSTTAQVDVNPANNANTIVMQGKDLEAHGRAIASESVDSRDPHQSEPVLFRVRQTGIRPGGDFHQAGDRQAARADHGDGQFLGVQFSESV